MKLVDMLVIVVGAIIASLMIIYPGHYWFVVSMIIVVSGVIYMIYGHITTTLRNQRINLHEDD